MTVHDLWHAVTALGDSGVLLPVSAMIALWLGSARRYRLAGQWCLTVAMTGAVVAVSKLLFMGWCFGLRSLDFTGISGHSAMAALVMPALVRLLQDSFLARRGRVRFPYGELLAVLVGVSRLAVQVHSPSEVAAGLLLGFIASRLFLHVADQAEPVPVNAPLATGSLLLLPGLLWLQPAPTQYLLEQIAVLVSGQHAAFTRRGETCDLQHWQVERAAPGASNARAVQRVGVGGTITGR